jgi:hypothetical protein
MKQIINKTATYRPSSNNSQKLNCGDLVKRVITGIWIMNKRYGAERDRGLDVN